MSGFMCFEPSEQASFDEGKKESEVSFQAESLREDNLSYHNTVLQLREISVGFFRTVGFAKKRFRTVKVHCHWLRGYRVVNISGGGSEVPGLSPPVGDMADMG